MNKKMKGVFFMKLLKKIIPFVVVLATVFSVFGVQNTFADSQIKKGSTRVVMFGTEIDPCEDEVVYQGHRYLPADYFISSILSELDLECNESVLDYSNGSVSYHFSPYGYLSFWGGSKKVRVGNWYDGKDIYLTNPAVLYDGNMYISMEDIADVWSCYYGFDASVNTMYFYYY